MKKYRFLILSIFFIAQIQSSYSQNFPTQNWEKAKNPIFYGWDINRLNTIEEYVIDSTATTGMMIIQDGKVIYEYGNISENSYIASCRKSIMAMLYGKYVLDGTIKLDKSLEDLGIFYDNLLLENEKKATVKDIISSRSGIYLPASNSGDMTNLAPKRGTVKAGEIWVYNNWDFNMAGYIFEKETKKNIYDEIETQFAIPLQMQDWNRAIQKKSGDNLVSDVMAYHIDFSTRDMARLGLLMLNKGKWNNQQLIPKVWVEKMTTPSSSFEELDKLNPNIKNEFSQFSYGYMWWLWDNPKNKLLEGSYSAQGAWGQNITVIPKMNVVIVIKTNDLYMRQKGNHNFIIDQIAQSYNPELNKDLLKLAESLNKNDSKQFAKDYINLPPKVNQVDFQNELNKLGYLYLEKEDYQNAMTIFELNINQYPTAWGVYDSMAEAYFKAGNYKESLKNYQKALLLNTDNEGNQNEKIEFIIKRIKQKI